MATFPFFSHIHCLILCIFQFNFDSRFYFVSMKKKLDTNSVVSSPTANIHYTYRDDRHPPAYEK